MWLPKEEKETLLFYYHQFVVGKIPLQTKKPWEEGIHLCLSNRGLIDITAVPAALLITLTPEGIRLGQKYNSKIGPIAVWCTEYMWLFVVLGAIIGAITLAVSIFKD